MAQADTQPLLQIQLLGGFHLLYGNESLTAEFSPRAVRLLAYLLLYPKTPLSRVQVAYTFWTDSSDRQARTNLRRELHALRRIFPPIEQYVEIGPQTLCWNPTILIELDLAHFERALNNANAATDVMGRYPLSDGYRCR